MCHSPVVTMSLCFFEGPAGSGKTTRIFDELAAILDARPLIEGERVLALTKMHGSRRRMQGRLSALTRLHGRFECTTIDSFAWRILWRWRSLVPCKGSGVPAVNDYDGACRCAGALLCESVVGRWVTRTFPILVIDEMQDSKDGQLEMVRALSESATCLAAADDYQDLDASGENLAVHWAQQNGQVVSLTRNHRTTATGLLTAASALRDGRAVPSNGKGFAVLGARNKDVGASFASKNLTWWRGSDDIAIITPVRAERSGFVRELIDRVEEKPIGNPAVGPHRVSWEVTQEDECEQFLAGLILPADPSVKVYASQLYLPNEIPSSKALRGWFDQQRRLAARTTFTVAQIRDQVRLMHQRSRAYRRTRDRGVRAMTIHQAKNREFDSVIVLWPYEVAGSADRQRRLLYNAVTRAKRQAIVIVQSLDRCNQPPFVPDCRGIEA